MDSLHDSLHEAIKRHDVALVAMRSGVYQPGVTRPYIIDYLIWLEARGIIHRIIRDSL